MSEITSSDKAIVSFRRADYKQPIFDIFGASPSAEVNGSLINFYPPSTKPGEIRISPDDPDVSQKLQRLLYLVGAVTFNPNNSSEFPVATRIDRAKILSQIQAARHKKNELLNIAIEAAPLFEEAHVRQELMAQIVSQGQAVIEHHPQYGDVELEYAIMVPLNSVSHDLRNQRINVILPGLLNRPRGAASQAEDITYATNRATIILGYPDSFGGTVSREFAQDVRNPETGFSPHAEIFETAIQALEQVLGFVSIDLYGFSTGCPIGATLVAEKEEIRNLTERFIAIAPAAAVDQTAVQFTLGHLEEIFSSTKLMDALKWVISTKPKPSKAFAVDPEKVRKQSATALSSKILKQLPRNIWQKTASQVPTLVLSGTKDKVVKSSAETVYFRELSRETHPGSNIPPLDYQEVEGASHITFAVELRNEMDKILGFISRTS